MRRHQLALGAVPLLFVAGDVWPLVGLLSTAAEQPDDSGLLLVGCVASPSPLHCDGEMPGEWSVDAAESALLCYPQPAPTPSPAWRVALDRKERIP